MQKVSPSARRRAARLEQARVRAQARRRRRLLIVLGAAIGAAVGIYLKRRSDRAAIHDVPTDEPPNGPIDLTDAEGSGEAPGAVRSAEADSGDGPVD